MDETERERRWALVLPHRQRLLGIARRLVRDIGDAEAIVHEAMLRCVTFDNLDESNVTGFLVVTTRRLCVDHHRLHTRDGNVAARLTGRDVTTSIEEAVCDRAEAAWVVARLSDMPERQRAVVHARSDGRSPREIAAYLDVSYKTVETLLYRARTRVRAEMEKAYGLVLLGVRRPHPAWEAAGMAAVTTAALLLTPGGGGDGGRTPAAAPPVVVMPVERRAQPSASPVVARPAARQVPTPRPRPVVVRSAAPAAPVRAPRPSPSSREPFRCGTPPYSHDACVDPRPNPEDPLDLELLNCVRYGIDREVGLDCRSSPTPTPDTEGEPR